MTRSTSWHIPHLPTYSSPPHTDIIFVVFLERMPENFRDKIMSGLNSMDEKYAKRFKPTIKPKTLRPVPWIRDHSATSDVLIAMLEPRDSDRRTGSADGHKSFIIVDDEMAANETCIAASWADERFSAARVSMSIANVALSAIDQGAVKDLPEALGDQAKEENKVDLYYFRKGSRPAVDEPIPYEIPAFVKNFRPFSRDRLALLTLEPLEESVIKSLKDSISSSDKGSQITTMTDDMEIINWEGEPPTRQQLVKIFDWLDGQIESDDRIGYVFFIDNVWQDNETGLPTILAASRTCSYGNFVPKHQISLLPLRPERVVDLWTSASTTESSDRRVTKNKIATPEDEERCAIYSCRERAVDTDFDIDYDGNGNSDFCTVYYLRPFTLSEQRTIRNNLIEPKKDSSRVDSEFAFMGYPFTHPPPANKCHTVQDLRSAFEKSDPFSPFFDPKDSTHRLNSYPRDFIALDDRILDEDAPQAILFSCLEMHHESNMLGWMYGYIPAGSASSCHANLFIANMGPQELIKGEVDELWLSDLKSAEVERVNDPEA